MRKENWPIILEEKIKEEIDVPFKWGQSDCMTFPARVAAAMLDYDLMEKAQLAIIQYDSEEGAKEVLREWFGKDMAGVIDLVFNRVPVLMAGRGDIVLLKRNDIESCGIVDSTGRRAACKSEGGILFVPLSFAVYAWRVE